MLLSKFFMLGSQNGLLNLFFGLEFFNFALLFLFQSFNIFENSYVMFLLSLGLDLLLVFSDLLLKFSFLNFNIQIDLKLPRGHQNKA